VKDNMVKRHSRLVVVD